MLNRSGGVLLNISSLPSKYGIGGFGAETEKFADFLIESGFHYWQTLPVTTVGTGWSPYSGTSAFAGNFMCVDPDRLVRDGLISREDAEKARYDYPYAVDYAFCSGSKRALLRRAFANFGDRASLDGYEARTPWLRDYALFMAIKDAHGGAPWWEWEEKYRRASVSRKEELKNEFSEGYRYYVFEQYIFDAQWREVRRMLAEKKIRLIGDMPMYVSLDSADVWGDPSQFKLDENMAPTEVAGVPPDYFSEDGQLWGNPLYDYGKMRKDGFGWWLGRFDRMAELYDVLRIDHFRAFSAYWAVDANAVTAKEGKWRKGVGKELFAEVFKKHSPDSFIAEDLGIIDDDVNELLAHTGLPCMRVMQFGFEDGDSIHLPHNFSRNCVGYTATHDNNTSLGWMYSLPENILDYMLRYIECDRSKWGGGGYDCQATKLFIRRLIASCCRLAIVPFQDLCGYGADCRMNTPGVADGNWTFRATDEALGSVDRGYFHYINCLYGRNRV